MELTAARGRLTVSPPSGKPLPRLSQAGRSASWCLPGPGVDLDDVEAVRRAVAAPPRKIQNHKGVTQDTARRAECLVTQVSQAARAARLLPLAQLESAHAKLLAEDLIEAVADLAVLAAGLTRRSREHLPTVRDDHAPPAGGRRRSEKPE